jgi:hypothetical protein
MVEIPFDADAARSESIPDPVGVENGSHMLNAPAQDRELATLRELVDTLRAQLDRANEQLDVRAREVSELHVLLQRSQGFAPYEGIAERSVGSEPESEGEKPLQQGRSWWQFWSSRGERRS